MLTLYFSPGACSMASHIGLEETGAPYEEKPTLLPKGEQKTEAYLNIVHPSYQRYMRSERFAEGEAAQATVKELGRKSFWDNLSLAFVISGVASGVNAQTWSGGDPFRASCILIHPAYNQCEQERIRAMAPIATR